MKDTGLYKPLQMSMHHSMHYAHRTPWNASRRSHAGRISPSILRSRPRARRKSVVELAFVLLPTERSVKWYHQNAKHLCNQPPVPRNPRPILHQFSLRTLNVFDNVLGVGVYSLYLFATVCQPWSSSKMGPGRTLARTPSLPVVQRRCLAR